MVCAVFRAIVLPVVLGMALFARERDALTPSPPASEAERFGVAFAVLAGPDAVQAQLRRLGAGSWYAYGLAPGADWGPGRVVLLRTGKGGPVFGDEEIAAAARARPGTAWLIGNEPNVPGQDEVDGVGYARAFERYRRLLKAADPTALIVAPNLQNVRAGCGGCEGTTVGADFLDAWRAAHRAIYGGEPAFDAFGLHLYDLDWGRLPMTDAAASEREVEAARAYLDAVPEWRGRPIWVTEMGVIWGFPGYEQYAGPDGSVRVRPRRGDGAGDGSFAPRMTEGAAVSTGGTPGGLDDGAVVGYLGELTRFLRDESGRLGVERWFAFTNAPYAEPYADAAGGVALFDGPGAEAGMTAAGRAYRALAEAGARPSAEPRPEGRQRPSS